MQQWHVYAPYVLLKHNQDVLRVKSTAKAQPLMHCTGSLLTAIVAALASIHGPEHVIHHGAPHVRVGIARASHELVEWLKVNVHHERL